MSYEIKIEKVHDKFGTMYRIICPDLLYLKELGKLHSEIDKVFIEKNEGKEAEDWQSSMRKLNIQYTQQDVYNDIYNQEKADKHREG